ncbi:hypothetical protein B0H10DRAFT_2225275 [Mycena sp. CBHHK59/15]|nr:hypothetical protein B0H10DRAFT_2225275 [Mycena sp. CBHHK59/15]
MPILLCAPIYVPDPGHENRWNFGGPFYAMIHREWKGAVTSLESLEKILERYPGTKVWQAEPWSIGGGHQLLANAVDGAGRGVATFPTSPTAVAPAPPYSSLLAGRDDTSRLTFKGISTSTTAAAKTPQNLSREELDELAYMRPRTGPISPQRLNQQFARVLGVQAVVQAAAMSKPSLLPSRPLSMPSRAQLSAATNQSPAAVEGARLFKTARHPRRAQPSAVTNQSSAAVEGAHLFKTTRLSTPSRAAAAQSSAANQCAPQPRTAGQGRGSEKEGGPLDGPGALMYASDAVKASRALAAKIRGDKNTMLNDRFKEIFAEREEQITSLTEEFDKTKAYIRQVLENGVRYTKKRATNLKNAIVFELSRVAREEGGDSNVRDVDIEGADYRAYRDSLSEERKAELIEQLEDHQDLKQHGVCATNKAVAMDAMQTSHQAGRVLINLHSRTGTRGFAMFTRGAIDDVAVPCWVDSNNTHLFFPEVLGISVYDMLCKLELWSCNCNKGKADGNDLDVMRQQLTEGVEDSLVKITVVKGLKMAWTHYKVDIVHEHGVELAGWPENVPIGRPSKLPAQAAHLILSKVKSGGIHWVALTRAQRKEIAKEIEAQREAGTLKTSKTRSDKSKKRGARGKKAAASDDDSEEDDDGKGENEKDDEPEPAPACVLARTRTANTMTTPAAAPVTAAPAAAFGNAAAPAGYNPDFDYGLGVMDMNDMDAWMPPLPRRWSEGAGAADEVAMGGWCLNTVNREEGVADNADFALPIGSGEMSHADLDAIDTNTTRGVGAGMGRISFAPGPDMRTHYAECINAPSGYEQGFNTPSGYNDAPTHYNQRFDTPTRSAPGAYTPTSFLPDINAPIGFTPRFDAPNSFTPGVNGTPFAIHARTNTIPSMASSISVFSVVTNDGTAGNKRKRGEGGKKSTRAPRDENDKGGEGDDEQSRRKKKKRVPPVSESCTPRAEVAVAFVYIFFTSQNSYQIPYAFYYLFYAFFARLLEYKVIYCCEK